jgi:sialate O-acetylesterase
MAELRLCVSAAKKTIIPDYITLMKKLILPVLLLCAQASTAEVILPRIFSSHMVLQRNKPIAVWGWATPNEKVSVSLATSTLSTKADKAGLWSVSLPALPAGGPYNLKVAGKNTVDITDVMVGEVWVCSGQSNMEWVVKNVKDAEKEMASATNPMIRQLKVPLKTSLDPKEDIDGGQWQVSSPATVGEFTAVGYFFARELYEKLKVPIGLINSSWGGTMVETWISGPTFFGDPLFADQRSRMPASFDAIVRTQQDKLDQLLKNTQGSLPPASEVAGFKTVQWNDAAWKTMSLPSVWENAGLPDVDGVVWFRREFQLPADLNLGNARIQLGTIDDIDSTWVNGVLVGTETTWNKERNYAIPPSLLHAGRNTIAVKVIDNGGGGGIYGDKGGMKVSIGSFSTPLDGPWKYRIAEIYNAASGVSPNSYPTLLYNAMIHPLIRYRVAGAIWYQGESNAGRAVEYGHSFPLMINDWRKAWKDSLPFFFVQLAAWEASGGTSQNGGSEWAELREAQTQTLQLPATGMAVTVDIGESKDIHPRNKQDVGKRLAAQALDKVYHQPGVSGGPLFGTLEIRGSQAILHFSQAGSGLTTRNRYGYLNAFEVAGADRQFHYARARIEGKDEVVVECDAVTGPVAVRYAWADDPADVNLYNLEGFPAQPFRTDSWPSKTAKAHYTIQ